MKKITDTETVAKRLDESANILVDTVKSTLVDMVNEKKDAVLDKAQQFLDKAFQLAPGESELFALQAFLYPSRITVDPMGRGMEYMGKMNQALDEAIRLNPDNPRSYYLRAITILNMPEGFGGGAASARPIFEVAKQKFYNFQPKTSISPDWGKEQNEMEMSKF